MGQLSLYTFSTIISKLFAAIGTILLARYLTKDEFGLYVVTISFVLASMIIVRFGVIEYILYFAPNYIKRIQSLYKQALKSIIILYLVLFPLSLIVYSVVIDSANIHLFNIIYIKAFLDIIILLISNYLQIMKQFNNLSKFMITVSLLQLISALLILFLELNLIYYIGINICLLLIFIVLYFFSFNNLSVKEFTVKNIFKTKILLGKSNIFFYSVFMSFIYTQSDLLMLGILSTPEEVARYSVVTAIIFASYLLPSSLYNYFFVHMSSSFKNNKLLYNKFLKKFVTITIIIMVPISTIYYIYSYEILEVLYSTKYVDSNHIFELLTLVLLFHSFCFISGAMLTIMGYQKQRTYIQLFIAILNVALNFYLIPLYGAEGAVYATLGSEVVLFLLYTLYSVGIHRLKVKV